MNVEFPPYQDMNLPFELTPCAALALTIVVVIGVILMIATLIYWSYVVYKAMKRQPPISEQWLREEDLHQDVVKFKDRAG